MRDFKKNPTSESRAVSCGQTDTWRHYQSLFAIRLRKHLKFKAKFGGDVTDGELLLKKKLPRMYQQQQQQLDYPLITIQTWCSQH
jgi:hypothetical protein